MLEGGEDARFIARRMIILASEDIGNADPRALLVATAAAQALEHVGLPEARLNLAQAAIYLARAPKSNASYRALARRDRRRSGARTSRPAGRAPLGSAAPRSGGSAEAEPATSTPTTTRGASSSTTCPTRSRARSTTCPRAPERSRSSTASRCRRPPTRTQRRSERLARRARAAFRGSSPRARSRRARPRARPSRSPGRGSG